MIGKPIYKFNHLDKVILFVLYQDPNMIPILEKHLDKVRHLMLRQDTFLLEQISNNTSFRWVVYSDKVGWIGVSVNPNKNHNLKKGQRLINTKLFYDNPNICDLICKYNYKQMKNSMKDFCEELVQKVFHPLRLQKICDEYGLELVDLLDMI